MQNAFLLQLFRALPEAQLPSARRFIHSPYFNRREDVVALFDMLVAARQNATLESLTKEAVYKNLYPETAFDSLRLNHVFTFLTRLLERFLAHEAWHAEPLAERFYTLRALRRHGLAKLFERDAALLTRDHAARPQRNAGWQLFRYQLENEVFSHRIVQQRGGATNLPAAVDALTQFFALEHLRWACTARSLQAVGGGVGELPLHEPVLALAETIPPAENPALALLRYSYAAQNNSDDESAFHNLEMLLIHHASLFPSSEARDLYMSAINFCIRRHNRGERAWTARALALYRAALDAGLLHENGVLPKYTYNNLHMLAQLSGERDWALAFLETYAPSLPAANRENTYRYNLAVHHYLGHDYGRTLELLRGVDFDEVFINLDVRRMLLKSYFELGEWPALTSLLDSFAVFLRRQQSLGYHRESYRNLVRFTRKVVRAVQQPRARRTALARVIEAENAVAERAWLLEKLQ